MSRVVLTTPARRPGRPVVGRPVNIRLGDDLLDEVDTLASILGESRAEVIRRLVAEGVRIEADSSIAHNLT